MVFFGGGKQICVTSKPVEHPMSSMNRYIVPLFHTAAMHSKLSSSVLELLAKALLAKLVFRLILIMLKKQFLLVSLKVSLYRFLPVPYKGDYFKKNKTLYSYEL